MLILNHYQEEKQKKQTFLVAFFQKHVAPVHHPILRLVMDLWNDPNKQKSSQSHVVDFLFSILYIHSRLSKAQQDYWRLFSISCDILQKTFDLTHK